MLGRGVGENLVTRLPQTTFYRFAEGRTVIDNMDAQKQPPPPRTKRWLSWSVPKFKLLYSIFAGSDALGVRPTSKTPNSKVSLTICWKASTANAERCQIQHGGRLVARRVRRRGTPDCDTCLVVLAQSRKGSPPTRDLS